MLFRKKIDQYCAYCAHGVPGEEDQVLCVKKGLVPSNGKCRRFRYDPLKRVPARAKPLDLQGFQPEDFSL